MEQINEKLQTQLKIEKSAIDLYNSIIGKIDAEEIKNRIAVIRDNEQEHVCLVEEMISIMDKYSGVASPKTAQPTTSLTQGFIDQYNTLCLVTSIEKMPITIVNTLKTTNANCIYISYNKIPRYIKKLLSDNNIDTGKIKFITCVKEEGMQESDDVFVHPEALTDLSINISTLMENTQGEKFILIDTISSFSIYHETEKILKFISNINSKISSESGILWIVINDENTELATKIGPLCDKVIEAK